jgi:hypothetical protein
MEFPLSRAPELFFDDQLWEIFVTYFASPTIAYERISHPPSLTGYYPEDYEARDSLSKERWQELEEACTVGRELLRDLQARFLSQELTATGIPRGFAQPTREPIPPIEWLKLWPNFAENWAMSTTGSYDDIKLSWNPKDKSVALQELCEAFLLKRKQDGESRRKILIAEAADHVGERVPIRTFNAAYQKTFKKNRGRPPSY